MTTLEGQFGAQGLRFAIALAKFNSFVTERMLTGALDALKRNGCATTDITVVKVPGSWELPVVVKELCRQGQFDAVIALGCLIRGATPHFDYLASEAAKGLGMAPLEFGIPVAFGVLTCQTLEQAIDRAGGKGGNKGFDAAMTAIEMANLMRQLRQGTV